MRITGKERMRGGRGKECMHVYYAFYIRKYPHWFQCFHYFLENTSSLARLRRTPLQPVCDRIYDAPHRPLEGFHPQPRIEETHKREVSQQLPVTSHLKTIYRTRVARLTCAGDHSASEVCRVIPLSCIITLFSQSRRMWASSDSIC